MKKDEINAPVPTINIRASLTLPCENGLLEAGQSKELLAADVDLIFIKQRFDVVLKARAALVGSIAS